MDKLSGIERKKEMIFVFPGQGSQKIGMGKDIYENFSEGANT